MKDKMDYCSRNVVLCAIILFVSIVHVHGDITMGTVSYSVGNTPLNGFVLTGPGSSVTIRCDYTTTGKLSGSYLLSRTPGNQETVIFSWTYQTDSTIKDKKFNDPSYSGRIDDSHTAGTNFVLYTIKDLTLADGNKEYGCEVYETLITVAKKLGNTLLVYAAPHTPTLSISPSASPSYIAGSTVTLTCTGNVGYPNSAKEGRIIWSYKSKTDSAPNIVQGTEVSVTELTSGKDQGTFEITSQYSKTLSKLDNLGVFTCQTDNTKVLTNNEEKPKTTLEILVLYPVEIAVISPNGDTLQRGGRYSCSSDGNPSPTIKWSKVSGAVDMTVAGNAIVVPDNAPEGDYSYKCTASNTVNGSPTSIEKTISFKVVVPTTPAPTTLPPTKAPTQKPTGDTVVSAGGGFKDEYIAIIVVLAVLVLIVIIVIIVCMIRKSRGPGGKNPENGGKGITPASTPGAYDVDFENEKNHNIINNHQPPPTKAGFENLVYTDEKYNINKSRNRQPLHVPDLQNL